MHSFCSRGKAKAGAKAMHLPPRASALKKSASDNHRFGISTNIMFKVK